MAAKGLKELRRWRDNPFTFRLSPIAIENRMKPGGVAPTKESVPCTSCGSVIVLGGDRLRNYKSNGKAFCDIQCAGDYKRWHNVSEEYQQKTGIAEFLAAKAHCKEEREKNLWTCCAWCFDAFKRSNMQQKYCVRCRQKQSTIHRILKEGFQTGICTCNECGDSFKAMNRASMRKFCSNSCAKRNERRNQKHRRRERERSGGTVSLAEVIKKYKGKCAICGVKTVPHRGGFVANGATIDHIIPLAKDGLHVMENIQLACHKCNSEKSDKMEKSEQMLLALA